MDKYLKADNVRKLRKVAFMNLILTVLVMVGYLLFYIYVNFDCPNAVVISVTEIPSILYIALYIWYKNKDNSEKD